ncbi:hypothetical protein IWZ03DRAFT_61580 [Phyllosticta citriasiana]|uniref:Uncharacterized protein n=1 Tax=Phyllosticta citriasiana TaxID=595635 RepID=A0ABR1KC23_9PEZI
MEVCWKERECSEKELFFLAGHGRCQKGNGRSHRVERQPLGRKRRVHQFLATRSSRLTPDEQLVIVGAADRAARGEFPVAAPIKSDVHVSDGVDQSAQVKPEVEGGGGGGGGGGEQERLDGVAARELDAKSEAVSQHVQAPGVRWRGEAQRWAHDQILLLTHALCCFVSLCADVGMEQGRHGKAASPWRPLASGLCVGCDGTVLGSARVLRCTCTLSPASPLRPGQHQLLTAACPSCPAYIHATVLLRV